MNKPPVCFLFSFFYGSISRPLHLQARLSYLALIKINRLTWLYVKLYFIARCHIPSHQHKINWHLTFGTAIAGFWQNNWRWIRNCWKCRILKREINLWLISTLLLELPSYRIVIKINKLHCKIIRKQLEKINFTFAQEAMNENVTSADTLTGDSTSASIWGDWGEPIMQTVKIKLSLT